MILVTITTADIRSVSTTIGIQCVNFIGVTGAAQLSLGFAAPLILSRLMGIVAGETIRVLHLFTVAVMAFEAIHELPLGQTVLLMALAAILFGVLARCRLHGTPNLRVTA
jgi:hypothetical protein